MNTPPDLKAPPPERRSLPRRMLNRLEVDWAVFYSLVLRFWQLGAGAVSLVLISWFFSPEVQGYYYTFSGILALQMFFELGLHVVIVSVTSHEWAGLRLDADGRIEGKADAVSRLVSLGRKLAFWYAGICLLFLVVVGIAGVGFFSTKPADQVAWAGPWSCLVVLTSMLLWTLPFVSLLEGCNQVATVNRYRLIQAVLANVTVWVAICLGAGLWTAVAATAVRVAVEFYLLGVRYRRFFYIFLFRPAGTVIRWAAEIWPMQWRIGAGSVFSYFEFSLFTPVMFHYHGAAVAGQMGMTWTLAIALQSAALSWVQTRMPLFGMLIAKRDFRELDRVFLRLTTISIVALAIGCFAAWSAIWMLNALDVHLGDVRPADRLLPPLPAGIFFLAIVLYQLPRCQDFYLRAHKREPLLPISITSSCLIGSLVWGLGSVWGPTGAAFGYLGAVVLFNLPARSWLWWRCRRAWH